MNLSERNYTLAFGPAAREYKYAKNIIIHQCSICKSLVVEDYFVDHEAWHDELIKMCYRHK